MDAVSYALSAKQKERIERVIANPDSNSGIVTVPKVIEAGETVTVPAGRVAVLPNVQVDGTLNVDGEVFIPSGATFSKVVETEGNQGIDGIKTFTSSPIAPTPTTGDNSTKIATTAFVAGAISGKQNVITGAGTTITSSDLTSDRALISNSSGKVGVSAVTSTELGYIGGVTSSIQTQLNAKAPLTGAGASGTWGISVTGNAGTVTNGVYTTGDQTIYGVKTFSSNPLSTATQSTDANALTKYSAVVKNTGDETIAGVKTFSSTISGSITGNAATVTNGVYTNSSQALNTDPLRIVDNTLYLYKGDGTSDSVAVAAQKGTATVYGGAKFALSGNTLTITTT